MNKPKGYDEAQAFGTPAEKIELGGHHMIIMKAEETTSKNGKEMLKVYLDTVSTDKQPTFFTNRWKNAPAPQDGGQKKWPADGTVYILTTDKDGNANGRLKGFITSVEASNPGATCQWGDGLCNWLKSKRVGGVFGIELDEYQGREVERRKLKYFCADDKVDSASIPNPTETDGHKYLTGAAQHPVADPDFMSVSDAIDGDLPFM